MTPARSWWLAVVGILALSARALGETCPAPVGGTELAAIDSSERFRFIEGHMREEATRARIWTIAWGASYSALAVGQAAPIPFLADPGLRIDFGVGAIAAAVGAVFVLAMPLKVMSDSRAVSAAGRTCDDLAEAERRFAESADDEDFGRSLWLHLADIGFNALLGVVLGVGFRRPWTSWAVTAGSGVLVGETMIFTQPGRLSEELERYRSGKLAAVPRRPQVSLSAWIPDSRSPGIGVAARVVF